jgi:hypothetical protein
VLLGKKTKAPSDRKKYIIDYDDWLDVAETASSMGYSVSPSGPTIDGETIAVDGRSVSFFISGGTAGETYTVYPTITTSNGQIKEDHILFVVVDP